MPGITSKIVNNKIEITTMRQDKDYFTEAYVNSRLAEIEAERVKWQGFKDKFK